MKKCPDYPGRGKYTCHECNISWRNRELYAQHRRIFHTEKEEEKKWEFQSLEGLQKES